MPDWAQIVDSCNLNFHTVVLYLAPLLKNGLAERVEDEIVRYRITPRGEEALGHLCEREKLMPKMAVVEEEIAAG